ncbi:hypothetical protein PR048_025089 [Dryococelus australis]|uniref:Uncharacterized protein n=1 Tax=Dryococelus australis TaxID=614101 RepID=A0ABQ9GQC4_9NEOP|nr:hypothetical protein PR048_025089 [Dryococelus australis]
MVKNVPRSVDTTTLEHGAYVYVGLCHGQAVLTELARFHALSLAMKRQQPELFSSNVSSVITEAMFVPENEEWYSEYYRSAADNALNMVNYVSSCSLLTAQK